jgi:uncharacterized membrane-anchored protein
MDKSSNRQLRLQQLVESLSVVAVSYYAVGLLSYLLKGFAKQTGLSTEQLTALSVLPVVLLVAAYMRHRVRKMTSD